MEKELVLNWINNYGYCDSYDYIAGYGSSDGCGYGDGYAPGSGYGDGSGYGYQVEYGLSASDSDIYSVSYSDGSGYDDGSGCGLGNGCGSGYGEGSGDGFGSDNTCNVRLVRAQGCDVFYIDRIPTIIKSIKGNYAKGSIIGQDYQITPCFVAKDEFTNSFAHGKTLREAVSALQEKIYQRMSTEDRIKAFVDNFKVNKAYKGTEFFNWHHILTGSCLMGRNQFVKDNGLDLNKEYTVSEFINLVENAFGGEIIAGLKRYYEKSL